MRHIDPAPRLRLLFSVATLFLLLLAALLALRPAAAAPLAPALLRVGDGRVIPYTVRVGGFITLPVTLMGAADVGTASAVIQFDPDVLRPVGCEKAPGNSFGSGVCNLHYAPDAIKFNAISVTGLNGEQPLYLITWQARAPAGSSSDVIPISAQLATPQGRNLPVDLAGSQVDVVGGVAGEDGVLSIGESGHAPYLLRPGETLALSVTLTITGSRALHALGLLLRYDPAVLRPGPCRLASPLMGACNPTFDPAQGLIKLNLVSQSGLQGQIPAFDLRFQAAPAAGPGATSALTPLIEYATDAGGGALSLLPLGADISLGQPTGQSPELWLGPPQSSGVFSTSVGITTTIPVWISQVNDLGAAALSLSYDPAVVRVLGCRVRQDARIDWGVCALRGDHAELSLISLAGLSGDLSLFELLLTPAAAAAVGASSTLTLTVNNLADTSAVPLPVLTHSGRISIASGSGPGVALLRLGDVGNGGQFDLPAAAEIETPIRIEGANDLAAVSVILRYQPAVVKPVACSQDPASAAGYCDIQATAGEVRFNAVSLAARNGDFTLASIRWRAAAGASPGDSSELTLISTTFADSTGRPLPVQTANGNIHIVTPAASGNDLLLRLGSGPDYIMPGDVFTLPLVVAPAPAITLTAATLLLHYNPAVLQVQTCQAGVGSPGIVGFCNPTFAPGQIKFNILSPTGISDERQIAVFTFTALALAAQGLSPLGQDAGLVLEPLYLATSGGQAPGYRVQSWPLLITGPDGDADGISNEIEANAPGGGDGNGDGTPDAEQANVTSLPNAVDGSYVTLAAPSSISIEDVRALAAPLPQNLPTPLDFPQGIFSFALSGLSPGQSLTLTIFLPPTGPTMQHYYKYGGEPGDPTPHWYDFIYDGYTGAEFQGNIITLHLTDGGRGDGDLLANGRISDPGGPASAPDDLSYRLYWPLYRD